MGGALVEADVMEKQLLSQMLEAVRITPSLHEDLQVEVMKVRANFLFTLHHLFPAVFLLMVPPTPKTRTGTFFLICLFDINDQQAVPELATRGS